MTVNGIKEALSKPVSLRVFLEARGMEPARVAVERNGGIVPRAEFDAVILSDSDTLEVVSFVGGG